MRGITGCGNAKFVLRQMMAKDHQGPASVKFRGHNQNTVRASGLQTAAHIVGLRDSGESKYGTNRDATGFAHRVHILLRDPDQLLIVNLIIRLSIQENARCNSLAE